MGEAEGCHLRLLWKVHVCSRENPRDRLAAGADRVRRSCATSDGTLACRRPELRHARVRRPHARPRDSGPAHRRARPRRARRRPAGRPRARRQRAGRVRDRRARAPLGRRRARASVPRPRRRRAGTRSGARRSTRRVQASLAEIAAALPPVAADAFDGDRDAMVHDLYPVVVDQIARDRLRADRVSLVGRLPRRPSALELFVDGLAAAESLLPPHSGYAALKRQLSRWVYDGLGALARGSAAAWKLSLHLDERTIASGTELVLELWLQAEDDPSLSLPASLVWDDGRRHLLVPARERPAQGLHPAARRDRAAARRARHRVRRRGGDRGEARRRHGGRLPARGDAAARGARRAGAPAERVGARAERLRVNLTATSRDPTVRSSGLLSTRGADALRLARRGRRRRR